jgi:hypothetical protein
MATKRKFSNWLHALAQHVEDTESARSFWLWSGLFCISSALERKVWLPYGVDPLLPNLYIISVGPPGKARKGPPVSFAKKLLGKEGIAAELFVDSPTKRALTQQMSEIGGRRMYQMRDEKGVLHNRTQSPIIIASSELSSFLAVDPKGMIEALTDLFDFHEKWVYKTSKSGEDFIVAPYTTCYLATTPTWMSNNLPAEAIGGGWTSRCVIVFADKAYKKVPIPPVVSLCPDLVHDLKIIHSIAGEFTWAPEARKYFDNWYNYKIDKLYSATYDERLHAYLARIHIISIKTAMCLHVAKKDSLVIEEEDIKDAILLCEQVLIEAPKAFGSQGSNVFGEDIRRICTQIRTLGQTDITTLMRLNWRHGSAGRTPRETVEAALDTLETMRIIKRGLHTIEGQKTEESITWIGGKDSDVLYS